MLADVGAWKHTQAPGICIWECIYFSLRTHSVFLALLGKGAPALQQWWFFFWQPDYWPTDANPQVLDSWNHCKNTSSKTRPGFALQYEIFDWNIKVSLERKGYLIELMLQFTWFFSNSRYFWHWCCNLISKYPYFLNIWHLALFFIGFFWKVSTYLITLI